MFDTVLVANRGEVAVRVTRTLRRLGVRSAAVYSDADAGARHVREADVALRVGPAAARESYLCTERLLDAAARAGAQAVHPGYGFLAESAAFARACATAGLVFVGPPPHAVEVMGDKVRARQAVVAAGVPVVPGRAEPAMTDDDLVGAAAELGYPVLVKPAAGGGGKGMRRVHDPADLRDALAGARREAAAAFGDDRLFLERLVHRPRHVEVQVLADAHGTVLHLGERECSLQRRHQKVVEEAPSPLLTAEARSRYGAVAVEAARTVGYTGAGTVEFVVSGDAPDEPFFLEMNTRLQVEHAVTELAVSVRGEPLDLVEQQLRVAAGERLAFGQADVRLDGHAVEARVYAEDPARGFLPTGGTAVLVREPVGEGVRVDSALLEGGPVATQYDPMLAKVAAWGPTRDAALRRLDRALAGTVVLGVGTNTGFLRRLLAHPDVRAGRLDTGLVERDLAALVPRDVPLAALAAFALAHRAALRRGDDTWDQPTGWRPGHVAPLRVDLEDRGGRSALTLAGDVLGWRGGQHRVTGERTPDGLLVTVDGTTTTAVVASADGTTWVHVDGETHALTPLASVRRRSAPAGDDAAVRSPLPGTVLAVLAADGDAVEAGAPLLVVEAMKMEHRLTAPVAGRVELRVRPGEQVPVGAEVAVVHPDGAR